MLGASTVSSPPKPKIEKPAGITPPANHRRSKMYEHLTLLLLLMVIFDVKVKITIKKR
jgi:hypothetical protein